jgi:hypothetical protein
MTDFDFLRSSNFKLLCHVKRTSVNIRDILGVMISVGGGHCNYSPWAPKKEKIATPLTTSRGLRVESKLKYIVLVIIYSEDEVYHMKMAQ